MTVPVTDIEHAHQTGRTPLQEQIAELLPGGALYLQDKLSNRNNLRALLGEQDWDGPHAPHDRLLIYYHHVDGTEHRDLTMWFVFGEHWDLRSVTIGTVDVTDGTDARRTNLTRASAQQALAGVDPDRHAQLPRPAFEDATPLQDLLSDVLPGGRGVSGKTVREVFGQISMGQTGEDPVARTVTFEHHQEAGRRHPAHVSVRLVVDYATSTQDVTGATIALLDPTGRPGAHGSLTREEVHEVLDGLADNATAARRRVEQQQAMQQRVDELRRG